MPDLIVVCGPTASGKTRLAIAIARRLHGEVISADSRQVYRGMDIGTGKDMAEYGVGADRVPCHLIDITEPGALYTVYDYQRDFYRVYKEIRDRRVIPVMAGGTGLYIESVLRKYEISGVPENERLRALLMQRDKTGLEKELHERDSAIFGRTDLSSKKRIVRALEIALTKDQYPVDSGSDRWPDLDPLVLRVVRNRSELHRRIDLRLEERLKQGMIDEVRGLIDRGISKKRLFLFGMEYRHIARHLYGEVGYEDMVEQLRRDIHRLAKRQETWFRGMARRGIKVYDVEDADEQKAFGILRDKGFLV